ncbi:MAG: RNA helicase, partial [Verrucomicrobiae bacterium]|nr:RNA helicase [Verrucomicrobiae bacterium]
GNGGAPAQQGQGQSHHQGQTHQQPARHDGGYDDEDDREPDHLPRHIDPLQTNIHGRRRENRGPSHGAAGQPDPMRTSIDVMGKGGGNRNKRNRGGGSGGGGGGGGGGNRRSGGFPR